MSVNLKKLLALPLMLLLSHLAFAKEQSTDTQTILPLEFNTGNAAPSGFATTTVTIQDKTLPLVLDMGAMPSGISLTRAALQGIKVQYTGQQKCFKMVDGKHCQAQFIIPEVQIGSFRVKNVQGMVMPPLTGKGFVETGNPVRRGSCGFHGKRGHVWREI